MRNFVPFALGLVVSLILISMGYGIGNWQWWAIMTTLAAGIAFSSEEK